jgi:MFS family permease
MAVPRQSELREEGRNVYVFGLTSFMNDTASEMAYWILPAFLVSIGAGPATLGIIEGISESVVSVAKLYSGYLVDRIERRKPIVVAGYVVANAVQAPARTGAGMVAGARDSIHRPAGQRSAWRASRHHARGIGRKIAAWVCLWSGTGHGLGRGHCRAFGGVAFGRTGWSEGSVLGGGRTRDAEHRGRDVVGQGDRNRPHKNSRGRTRGVAQPSPSWQFLLPAGSGGHILAGQFQ